MTAADLFERLGAHQRAVNVVVAPALVAMVFGVYVLVYQTGGIKYVYSHSMYLPILLSGFAFGIEGGVLFGLLGGIVLGPFMPINVATGEPQNTANWLYRTGFFTLIGFLGGFASGSVRSYLHHVKWASRHDAATGLPNRQALLDALADTLGPKPWRKDARPPPALIVLALENGMELRSAFGSEIIEEIVRQSARHFRTVIGSATTIFRIETEQVGAVAHAMPGGATEAMLARVVEAHRQPFRFNDIAVHADIRIGYLALSETADPPDTCLRNAQSALTLAHETGHGWAAYSPRIGINARHNLSLLGELRNAVAARQLSLHYQPKIAMRSGRLDSVEALMRWHHPTRGDIPPGIFIPRAEQSTLIHLLTEYALEEAMEQIVRWRRDGMAIPIAVNVAPANLLRTGFADLVLRLLNRYDLSGDLLELELTEGALMTDIERSRTELSRLADAGVSIAIDDFGTGYSSLRYLHQLPISCIKIDQSFVRRLPDDDGARHIIEAAVSLARRMGMKTVAEGIEHPAAYDLLGQIGCDIAQGFLISRPLPEEAFAAWCRDVAQGWPARRPAADPDTTS
ncbi:MAG: putative bifunctional diguanylate cyclase/phosphodiesterase [Burkholderiaceae bacterium]